MKTIIFYRSSYRGNTLKIAESMADALFAELVSIDSNPSIDLSDYDLIGFGSAINFAAHDIRLQRFVSSQNLKGKNVFVFSTRCRPFLGAIMLEVPFTKTEVGCEVLCVKKYGFRTMVVCFLAFR